MERNWKIHTTISDGAFVTHVSVRVDTLPVTSFKLFFRSRAADEVRLRLETASPLVEPSQVWEHFACGELYCFSCDWLSRSRVVIDRPMFVGTLVHMAPSDTGDACSAELVFLGGWYYLEKTIFGDDSTLSGYGQFWHPRDIAPGKLQANALVRCALFRAARPTGSGIFYPNTPTPNTEATHLWVAVDVSTLQLPPLAFNSNTCAQAVWRAISFWPDVQTWTAFNTVSMANASGGTRQFPFPMLYVKRRREAPTDLLPVDADEPENLDGSDDPTGAEGSIMVFGNGKVVSRRYETAKPPCPGVMLIKLDEYGRAQAIFHTSGSPRIEDRLGLYSLALVPEEYENTNIFDYGQPITSILPYEIWSGCLLNDYWTGTVVLSWKEPPGLFTIRPDKWLGLNLGLEPSPIQSVEFDIGLGLTTIETGLPAALEPNDLLSITRANFHWHYTEV